MFFFEIRKFFKKKNKSVFCISLRSLIFFPTVCWLCLLFGLMVIADSFSDVFSMSLLTINNLGDAICCIEKLDLNRNL